MGLTLYISRDNFLKTAGKRSQRLLSAIIFHFFLSHVDQINHGPEV